MQHIWITYLIPAYLSRIFCLNNSSLGQHIIQNTLAQQQHIWTRQHICTAYLLKCLKKYFIQTAYLGGIFYPGSIFEQHTFSYIGQHISFRQHIGVAYFVQLSYQSSIFTAIFCSGSIFSGIFCPCSIFCLHNSIIYSCSIFEQHISGIFWSCSIFGQYILSKQHILAEYFVQTVVYLLSGSTFGQHIIWLNSSIFLPGSIFGQHIY